MAALSLRATRAFYIKLGRGGIWEADSISRGILRLGWGEVPLRLIQRGDWASITRLIRKYHRGKPAGIASADLNALRNICLATPNDVWLTFHDSRLWWGRVKDEPVRKDATSKYRKLRGGWRSTSLAGHPLTLDQVPGVLAKYQAFRGTSCSVRELDIVTHLLEGRPSTASVRLQQAIEALEQEVASAVTQLHWKDFEILVDLVFQGSTGWQRRSRLGETMKAIDLELEDPLTRDVYQVQVKSQATAKDFRDFAGGRPAGGHIRRSYFVVHTPSADLQALGDGTRTVQLVTPKAFARMVLRAGRIGWVSDRIRFEGGE
jgi:hypothetical protein